jgi:peptidoglycan/xylan/chitin deacetylase (PgdA/CDA1 family)
MRFDRLLTLYLFQPLQMPARGLGAMRIPILMYHSVAEDVDGNLSPYFRTVTTPKAFDAQMQFLSQSGFQALTLSQALSTLSEPAAGAIHRAGKPGAPDVTRPPPRPIVITFDDGFRDFYTTAFPIMRRYDFVATVFVTTGYLGKTFVTGRPCLTADDVIELARQGVEFGSHTVSHPQLKNLSRDQIAHELRVSKHEIETIIGSEVTLFSYPYRFPEEDSSFTRELGDLLVTQGYRAGVTTAIGVSGVGDNPLFLRRLPVNDCDDTRLFGAKLNGAYDWLHTGQLLVKRLRALRTERLN